MRTGRPRSFCKDMALDKAMNVFWRHGYEGASMSMLTEAMGINSPSLYACFSSKEGLFKAVLERYDQRRVQFMQECLDQPTPQEVAAFFLYGVVAFTADTGGKTPPGCLMLQGGLSCCEEEIPNVLARHRAEKEAMLCARFEQAKKTGELAKDADAPALARYLGVMANGICVQAAAGATVEQLREVAAIALQGFPGTSAGAKPKPARKTAQPA